MPPHCVVPLCSEKGGHKFPQDEVLLEKWLIAIRRKNLKLTQNKRVCRKHFKPEDYIGYKNPNNSRCIPRLKTGTVPSQFTWTKDAEEEKREIERAEKFLQVQKKQEAETLRANAEENKHEERNLKRKQKFLKKIDLKLDDKLNDKLNDKNDDASKMDFNLEDEDDMIVIVVGDEDEKKRSKISKTGAPINEMPYPFIVKEEPLEEDQVVSLNVENIIKTVVEHGQMTEIKVEPDDYVEYEQLDDDFEQLDDEFEQPDDNERPDDYKQPDDYESHDDEDYEPSEKKSKNNNKSPEEVTKRNKRQHRIKKPPVSFVEEVRKSFPEFRKDKKGLIKYLANAMRLTVPPPPPQDYYIIDVDGKLICSYCEYITETLAAAARHYQNSHGTRYLVCYACGADFWSKVNLYKHELRCTKPDAKLMLQARGEYLGRKGSKKRPYLSGNKFQPRMSPLDPATGEEKPKKKKFECNYCSAEFVHIESWDSHENIHKGIRPYKCEICPSAYPSKVGLRKHRMTHGDQQFTCDHCNKSFKLKVTLITHMNTHLPQPKYGCTMCSKRYAQKTALRVHVNRDHLNLPPACACPQCPKRYPRMSHLKEHMLKEHALKLMTRKMFYKNLPRMNLKELKAAQVVFNQPQPIFSNLNEQVQGGEAKTADEQFADEHYLELSDDDLPEPEQKFVKQPNVKFVEQPNVKFVKQPNVKLEEQTNVKFVKQPNVKFEEQPNVKFVKQPNVKLEKQPNVKFVQQQNVEFVEQPNVQMVKQPNVKFVEQPNVKFVKQPNVKFVEQPNVKFVKQPNVKLEEQPNVKFVQQPNVKFVQQPNVKFVQQPNVKFVKQPNVKLEEQPNVKLEEQPNVKFVKQPNVKFVEQPNVKFVKQPNVKLVQQNPPVYHIRS